MSGNKSSGPLSIDIPAMVSNKFKRSIVKEGVNSHRDSGKSAGDCDTSNCEEAVTDSLNRDPVVDVPGHTEGEHILDKL